MEKSVYKEKINSLIRCAADELTQRTRTRREVESFLTRFACDHLAILRDKR